MKHHNPWKEKLTPWFPGETKPVRPGIYMVDQSWPGQEPQRVFSYWDGAHWYPQASKPEKVMQWICYGPRKIPFRQWCGILEKK